MTVYKQRIGMRTMMLETRDYSSDNFVSFRARAVNVFVYEAKVILKASIRFHIRGRSRQRFLSVS